MAGRFQRRLTVVRGGAGFGKTTLLLQALETNEDGSQGMDCWLGLGARDARPSELGAALRAAVEARAGGDVVDSVCDAIWRRSPTEITLILDDVHHVEPGGPGADLLARLLYELPANGHLVLVGRRPPPVAITRLLATGEAIEIDEDHLAFTPAEQATFLSMRGAAAPTEHRAGWPALVELTATVGAGRVESYLWEEILQGLSPTRRTGLARLAPLDWIDDARIAAITGTNAQVEDFVADLPLTSVEPNGAVRLHALWEPVLKSIDPAWSSREFQHALEHLAEGGYYREATELCLHNDREEDIVPMLKHLVQADWQSMAPEALETLIATLPRTVVSTPLGELLKGLLVLHSDPLRAEPFILSAQRGLRDEGDMASAYVTLSLLSYLAFFRVDRDGLEAIARQAEEFGGEPGKQGAISVRATLALVECRSRDALVLIDEARRRGAASVLGAADAVIAAMAFLDSGQPDRALAEIQAAIPTATTFILPALWGLQFDGMWLSGRLDPSDLALMDAGLPDGAGGHAHNQAVAHSILGFQNACLGRTTVARRHLESASTFIERGLGDRANMAYATGRMALAACEGDELAARRAIEEIFARHDPATLAHRHSLRASALGSVISETVRARVTGWRERGPCWALALDTAEALLAFRQRGETKPAATLPWDTYRSFAVALVPPMILELAVASASRGNAHARAVAEELAVDHRDVLRRLAEGEVAPVAREAKALLRTMPERPRSALELRILGPLELVRDGKTVDDPALRRERVRDLLHYLAAHGEGRREDLCRDVWPELPVSAAANNLRVTLSHIRNLLEPDRDAGAPSFFLPQTGDVVALRVGDGLAVDAGRFEQAIQRAEWADAAGDPGTTLSSYEEAIGLHRGDYLADASDPSWGDSQRQRIRSRLVGGFLRVAELRLGRNELDRAVADLQHALVIEPQNEAVIRTHAVACERRDGHAAARQALLQSLEPLEADRIPEPETRRLAARFGIEVGRSEAAAPSLGLSSRELEVIRLVDRGLSNVEIAKELFVAPSTVKTHLENVYQKLGVRRRTHAVSIVRGQGLLS